MDWIDLLVHFFNFTAPALAPALLLPPAARLIVGRVRAAPAWWTQMLVNFAVGVAALGLGLWFFGHDGKMASYGALLLATASSQWLLLRAWR